MITFVAKSTVILLLALSIVACASGKRWVHEPFRSDDRSEGLRLMEPPTNTEQRLSKSASVGTASEQDGSTSTTTLHPGDYADDASERPALELKGTRRPSDQAPADGSLLGVFRNTYYDFPSELNFTGATVPLMAPSCEPIAKVSRQFFEAVCVQGSGTMKNGQTVSFSKRDCECAETCPRTRQKICFDALDPQDFPWGRGARGTAITPLLTVAVDSQVIPLGTKLYIPEYDGVARSPGGTRHDGCFLAEDRGLKVTGEHVDVFTGNPSVTAHLNELVPSNAGVHVYIGTARCQ